MTTTIRGVQVSQVDAPLRVVDLPEPRPGSGQVRIAVEACGICHSDADMVHGMFGEVRAITEQAPLQDAPQAFDKMLAGKTRYRGVLTPSAG